MTDYYNKQKNKAIYNYEYWRSSNDLNSYTPDIIALNKANNEYISKQISPYL
jgi:hypothetical protein